MAAINKTIKANTMKIPKGIQSGAKTHHHDHAITLVSLRTMKATVNRLGKDAPATLVDGPTTTSCL